MALFIFHLLALVLFCYFSLSTVYLFGLAVAGRFFQAATIPVSKHRRSVCIVIPAYKEDIVLVPSVIKACEHKYQDGNFSVVVVGDQLNEGTVQKLQLLPVTFLNKQEGKSSKAGSLYFAIGEIDFSMHDIIVILDADNVMAEGCLDRLNDAFSAGFNAVQAHRTAKNTNRPIALLDAISEEINLNIFRKGAFNIGLSPAPMGSGMAFSKKIFSEIFSAEETLQSFAEDRQVENYLSEKKIRMAFLDDAVVYDEKVSSREGFQKQRIRWMEAQQNQLAYHWQRLMSSNAGNKQFYHILIHAMLLPRVLYLVLTIIFMMLFVVDIYVYPGLLYPPPTYWLISVFLYWLVLLISVPRRFYNLKTVRAIFSLPLVMFTMVAALFKLKKNRKEFLHTPKSFVSDD